MPLINHCYGGRSTFAATTINDTFSNNDWDTIIEACQSGSIPSAWAVGDSKAMTIDGADYMVDIIGKNHDTYADDGGIAPLTFQLHDCLSTKSDWKASYDDNISIMPLNIQSALRAVSKANHGNTYSWKLFILSEDEVGDKDSDTGYDEGTQYAYYSAGNSKIKKINGRASSWWLSSYTNKNYYQIITETGEYSSTNVSTYQRGIAFGFCF